MMNSVLGGLLVRSAAQKRDRMKRQYARLVLRWIRLAVAQRKEVA